MVEVILSDGWKAEPWLMHGFTTRRSLGGFAEGRERTWNFGFGVDARSGGLREEVVENRKVLAASVAESGDAALVTIRQLHSAVVRRAGAGDAGEFGAMWGDGLITDEPGVLLGILTADCLPILLADRRRRAVGALHAGWRGTAAGIAERGVEEMAREFGSDPREMSAVIGPGIGDCCFEVGSEVRQAFVREYSYADELFGKSASGRLHLNLVEANRRQLMQAGLAAEAIVSLDACTSCDTGRFFSHRAERGKSGRMIAVIGVRQS